MAVTEPLAVEVRESRGKQAAKNLRRSGKVPGVVYRRGEPGTSVSIPSREFARIVRKHGQTSLVELDGLPDGKQLAIYKELQLHPVSHEVLHVDLLAVEADEKVAIEVEVILKGLPIGVDKRGGTLVKTRSSVEIACLPNDIPEYLVLDVSALDVGDALHIGDANLPEKFSLVTPARTTVATVSASRETIKQMIEEKKAAAGEAPAEEGAEA